MNEEHRSAQGGGVGEFYDFWYWKKLVSNLRELKPRINLSDGIEDEIEMGFVQ